MSKVKKRKLFTTLSSIGIALGLVVVLLISFAGKSGGGKVAGAEINVMSVQDPFYFGVEQLIPQFEEESGIKVNFEGLAYDALHAKIITSFVGKKAGVDVVTVDQMWLSQYADNNWILDLTPYIEKDKEEVRMDDFVPEVIYSMNEWRGRIYTMPICSYGQFVMYHTELMKKAGLISWI